MSTQVLSSPIWQTIGAIIAIITAIALGVLFILNPQRSAKEKIRISIIVAIISIFIIVLSGGVIDALLFSSNHNSPGPTGTTTPIRNQTPAQSPLPMSTPNSKLFTCISGAICSSYPINIWITNVVINADQSSTWNFQIKNGENAIDVYLDIYLDNGGIQYGVWKLNSNENESISVPLNAAPINGSVHKIIFDMEGNFPENINPEYSQSCIYSASQKTCQP